MSLTVNIDCKNLTVNTKTKTKYVFKTKYDGKEACVY